MGNEVLHKDSVDGRDTASNMLSIGVHRQYTLYGTYEIIQTVHACLTEESIPSASVWLFGSALEESDL